MQLSNSGGIILIDDNYNEAKPLIQTFGKQGIPFYYYDGKIEDLPDEPHVGIRFVFLDIELQGMEGQEDKTKASGLTGRLKKIISKSNGPYIIIFWTKHNEIIDLVITNCSEIGIPPVACVDLEKSQCIDESGEFKLDKILTDIKDKLKSVGAFRLYIEWENILHTSGVKFIHEFSNMLPLETEWSEHTSAIFYELYKTFVGKNDLADKDEQFKCAGSLLNRCFLDTLQSTTDKDMKLPEGFSLKKKDFTDKIKAKLNKLLFLSDNLLSRPSNGFVYIEENKKTKESLTKSIFKSDSIPNNIQLCKVLITPECDLAQNKTPMHFTETKSKKIHRIVFGLIFDFEKNLYKKIKGNKKDAEFIVGPFWNEDNIKLIILHFSTISFQNEGELKSEPLFSLRRDLIFDLQSKAANHVNRLGNFQLN